MTYSDWLENIIVKLEPAYICEDFMSTQEGADWCHDNCCYVSIQKKCLRHIYNDNLHKVMQESTKGGEDE